jgi:hypothetical protein
MFACHQRQSLLPAMGSQLSYQPDHHYGEHTPDTHATRNLVRQGGTRLNTAPIQGTFRREMRCVWCVPTQSHSMHQSVCVTAMQLLHDGVNGRMRAFARSRGSVCIAVESNLPPHALFLMRTTVNVYSLLFYLSFVYSSLYSLLCLTQ